MTLQPPLPLYMTRCDPAQNMARFYAMSLAPTLFGEVSLMRNWGRIGSKGQVMMETFQSEDEAIKASERLAAIKMRKGYLPPCPTDHLSSATT